MSKISGIQGQVLQVTVVSGKKLRDTEMFTEQDPYVCLEYANSRLRTRTCKDGGRNPVFGEKFQIPLVEGLTDLNIVVWNSNTLRQDDFIGSGRPAGQVQLVMQISGTSKKQKPSASAPHAAPPASPYGPPPPPLGYPPVAVNIYPGAGHPPPGAPYQPYGQPYAPPPAGYYYPPPAGSYPGNYPPHC
ncbi:Calcium-dependent lipid-binding (CaLB domain) family protein [Rhynchospora pubera]|uniref:Calcium-dependent lipid-binding (CaLB domain) family protein n=1 Tax=Rhynchospora pubera TaxID=906938 RepID=A0AAV8F8H9_9POAL|nr:Calcium-dependent lipid-binding (CaLB domain) family protein [Rhynchospora pubera]KAJ4789965.1 Calcium-dependent lipid-binding (CaLB domain) family protein [Rhynchospora pubera]